MGSDMFDTMTLTKVVGALCGALLIFLLGNWAGEAIYSSGETGKPAYSVAAAGAAAPAAAAAAGPDFKTVYASADASKGESVFKKCTACGRYI